METGILDTAETSAPANRGGAWAVDRGLVSAIWIFVSINYVTCDVLSIMEPAFFNILVKGEPVSGFTINQGFLLFSAALLEIPFAMILLARLLAPKANKRTNIAAAALMIFVQAASLVSGSAPTYHYIFFSIVEIAGMVWIIKLVAKPLPRTSE